MVWAKTVNRVAFLEGKFSFGAMKPKSWALLSAFGCGIPTLVGGTVILSFGAWFLRRVAPQYQEGIKTIAGIKNDPDIMIPIAIGISAILAVFLGCGVGFLVYRWRQKKEAHRPPVQST